MWSSFYSDWRKMGFFKGAFHYMKKNAEADKTFTLNAHVKERLGLSTEAH